MRLGPLVIAIVLALVAGFIALQMLGGEAEQAPVVTETSSAPAEVSNVYIAAQFIPIGSVITPEMVTSQPWPSNLVTETFVTDAQPAEALVGKVARSSFQNGEPISITKLSAPGEGSFMAGSLPKGMRAVTINTDETLGVAGFVFPGDRVDILVTHQVPKWDRTTQSIAQEQITEPLLTNVSVLAVDQIANAQEIQANSDQQQEGAPPSTIHVARTVTLMVNPIDGEKLRLAEQVGRLSMALRSIEDHDTVDMAALLRTQHITQYPLDSVVNPGAGGEGGVRIIRGVQAESVAPVAPPVSDVPGVPMLANPIAAPAADAPASESAAAVAAPAPNVVIPEQVAAPAPLPAPPATPAAAVLQ